MTRIDFQLLILLVSLLALGCTAPNDDDLFEVECHCSIIQLIVHPQKYEGTSVRVRGMIVSSPLQPSQLRLYLSENDAKYMIDVNSIWIDMGPYYDADAESLKKYYGKYVVVDGTFAKRDQLLIIERVNGMRVLAALSLDEEGRFQQDE